MHERDRRARIRDPESASRERALVDARVEIVPSLREIDLGTVDAQRTLRAAGFTVLVDYVASTQPADRVVRQAPSSGARVRRGTTVRLSVSQGPSAGPLRSVPDVVGLTQDEAAAELRSAGFRVRVFAEPTPDPEEEGLVIRQTPGAGRRVPSSAVVTIYVGEPSG